MDGASAGALYAVIKDLPEPARRRLAHVVAPGTPLWRTAVVTMRGQIRLGAWRRFTAHQVITVPEGYIWAATHAVMFACVRTCPAV